MSGETAAQGSGGVRKRPFFRRHRWLLWTLLATGVVVAAITVTLAVLARRFEPYLRARLIEGLEQRFHTRVELGYFHVSVRPGIEAEWGLWAMGRNLRIWPPHLKGKNAGEEEAVEAVPLIALEEFSFHVPLRWEQTQALKIPEVRLRGLEIHVPPKGERDKATGLKSAVQKQAQTAPGGPNTPGALANLTVKRILCDNAHLVLETDKPGKIPLDFDIQHLELDHVAAGEPMQFKAVLTNPQPKGLIHSSGKFGPWDQDDPGASPVVGSYSLEKADLSTIKGIAGTLDSTGSYDGTLRALNVLGQANVADFKLTHFENTLPLRTRFHARVDGTDGDTWLDPVDATLGHSHFITRGQVVRVRLDENGHAARKPKDATQEIGHEIDLDVIVDRGQMDDFMRLVSKTTTPMMTGDVTTQAKLHIPPGKEPVHLRIDLDGKFALENARFTDPKMQAKVEELSERGLGHPHAVKNTDPNIIPSQMEGEFHLADGVMKLPHLGYSVPGAQIELRGTYALEGQLHFDGVARMQATVSKMVGGWKGFLLKSVDPFFRKDGAGAVIPIKVRGTRKDPDFGLDLGRLGSTHPQRPDGK